MNMHENKEEEKIFNNNNIVSIIGGRVVLIPSIDSLQSDLFPSGGPNVTLDLTNLYCLNGKKRRLKNSSLKRSRTTFEPRYSAQKTTGSNNASSTGNAHSRHAQKANRSRNMRKPLSSMSLAKRRSVSCGALLTVVQE
eukprot:UN01496